MSSKKRKREGDYTAGCVVEIEPSPDQLIHNDQRWYARIDSWDGVHYQVQWIYCKQELAAKVSTINLTQVQSHDLIQTDHKQKISPKEIRGLAPQSLSIRFKASFSDEQVRVTRREDSGKLVGGSFRTTARELCELISSKLPLLSDQPICDTAWVAEKKRCIRSYHVVKATTRTASGIRAKPCVELTVKNNADGKEWTNVPHNALLTAYPWPKSNVSNILLPPGPIHHDSRERSEYFADKAAPLVGANGMIITLDGPFLETVRALYRRGISPSQIIVAEINPATCVHQLMLVRGTELEGLNILYCKLHVDGGGGVEHLILQDRFGKYDPLLKNAITRIKCLYLDYCGDMPNRQSIINPILDKLTNLQLIGFTRCKRNTKNTLPKIIPGWTPAEQFNHSKVDSNFFIKTPP